MRRFFRRLFMPRVEYVELGSKEKKFGYLVTYTHVVTNYRITSDKAELWDGQITAIIEPEELNKYGHVEHHAIPADRVKIL